jgi:hypothetical protein
LPDVYLCCVMPVMRKKSAASGPGRQGGITAFFCRRRCRPLEQNALQSCQTPSQTLHESQQHTEQRPGPPLRIALGALPPSCRRLRSAQQHA